ncbi:MAG: hypothetical protein KBE09_04615 [Candidatus Pacebacteria bacterium]|nr:hypothetical protein [Candidatus Paceibacterota bacterium]
MKDDLNYNDIEQQLEALKSVSLSAREKLHTREVLEEFMAFRPVRVPTVSPVSGHYFYFHPMPMIALLLLVVMTTSTAAAAEGALPGDLLYPIKVHVTEEVRAAVAVQPSAKAAWAIERAERRLDEAAQLNTENRLDDDVREELALAVETHVRAAEALVLVPENTIAVAAVSTETDATAPTPIDTPTSVSDDTTDDEDESSDDSEERERVLTRIAIARETKARLIERHVAIADTQVLYESNAEGEDNNRRGRISKEPVAFTMAMRGSEVSSMDDEVPASDTFAATFAMEASLSTGTPESLADLVLETATSTEDDATTTASTSTEREVRKVPNGRLRGLQEGVRRRIESTERSLANAEARYGATAFTDVRAQLEKIKDVSHSPDQKDELLDDAEDALKDLLDVMEKTQGTINILELEGATSQDADAEEHDQKDD